MTIAYEIKTTLPDKQPSGCLIIGIFEDRKFSSMAKIIDGACSGLLSSMLKQGDIDGRIGQTLVLHHPPGIPAERLLLVGCGQEGSLDAYKYRQVIGHSMKALEKTGAVKAHNYLTDLLVKQHDQHWNIYHAVWITSEFFYKFNKFKSDLQKEKYVLHKMSLFVSKAPLKSAKETLKFAEHIASGVTFSRDLANYPANICTPKYLATCADKLGEKYSALKVTVLDEAKMRKLGMGAFLAVSKGSREPAKLITMEYKGAPIKSEKPIVLIGKGVTFDTGGISLKPPAAMDEMKFDMCGGASVFGVIKAVSSLQLPINLVGIVPATENMPDGEAVKPGDIVKSHHGKTIEILNTDAEGRLILCDALSYSKKFKPDVVIDIATLTGACVISLGRHATGLLSNNGPLAKALLEAGEATYDRAWQLPLWQDYQNQLNSPFADMANIGGREAGTITAACFLSRFTEDYQWAHLDIAGTAWRTGSHKGATGRPVKLLMQYILNRCAERKK